MSSRPPICSGCEGKEKPPSLRRKGGARQVLLFSPSCSKDQTGKITGTHRKSVRTFRQRGIVRLLSESMRQLLPICALNLARPAQSQKESLPLFHRRQLTREEEQPPPGLASALHVVGRNVPATLSKALIRLYLVYPLASFDVSGQWLVYHAAAWPNEVSICVVSLLPQKINVKT